MFEIAIVGEAWGVEEESVGKPFVGAAGKELDRMLADAGIRRADCFVTNVFNFHPPRNDITYLCSPKSARNNIPGFGPLSSGKYVRAEYTSEIARLYSELRAAQPNIIIALGNTASWALLNRVSVGKLRGTVNSSPFLPYKVIPTYHPAAVLRQYDLRHVTVLDLAKAKRESAYSDVRRLCREIWIEPSLADMEEFAREFIEPAPGFSFDIETKFEEITCIGFAPDATHALVVPFSDTRKPSGNYWMTLEEELSAWNFVARLLASGKKKVGQNGLYDIQYLWMKYGIPVLNYCDDTMLLHHSLFPESEKGLAFLGSVYTQECAWKLNRPKGKSEKPSDDEE